MPRLYSLTDAGRKAWDTQSSRVPLDYRRVLGCVGRDTDPMDIGAKLGWSDAAVSEVLRALEEGGMVKSIAAGPSAADLDFTGQFLIADIEAAQRKK
jgi:hypothetical protein